MEPALSFSHPLARRVSGMAGWTRPRACSGAARLWRVAFATCLLTLPLWAGGCSSDPANVGAQSSDALGADGGPDTADTAADLDVPTEADAPEGAAPDADAQPDETGGPDIPPLPSAPACDEATPCPEGARCVGAQASAPGACLPAACTTDADCAFALPETARGCCTREPDSNGVWPKFGACRLAWTATCPANTTWGTLACGLEDATCDDEKFACVSLGLGTSSCLDECSDTKLCPPDQWCDALGFCIPPPTGTEVYADCSARGRTDCAPSDRCYELGRWGIGDRQIALCISSCSPQSPCPAGSGCVMESEFFGYCLPNQGTVPAGGSCAHDPLACAPGLLCLHPGTEIATCSHPAMACGPGEVSAGSIFAPQTTLFRDPLYDGLGYFGCTEDHPPLSIGEACAFDPIGACGTGSCRPGGCTMFCDSDADCPGGHCPYEGVSGVLRTCASGVAGEGEGCASALDCASGMSCVPEARGLVCRRNCGVRGPLACPDGSWCDGATCQPAGAGGPGAACPNGAVDCAAGLLCHPVGAAGAPACRARCGPREPCASGDICHRVSGYRGFCAPPGAGGLDADCTGEAAACAPGLICFGAPSARRCVVPASPETACPAGTTRTKEALGPHPTVCLPSGSLALGADCASTPLACAEGLECVGPGLSSPGAWARCQPRCGTPYDVCPAGLSCRHIQQGRAWCLPDGAARLGAPCDSDPTACPASSLCTPGATGARCLATCLPGTACPDATTCTVSPAFRTPLVPPGRLHGHLDGHLGVAIARGRSPAAARPSDSRHPRRGPPSQATR
jgi:hypothetical protein